MKKFVRLENNDIIPIEEGRYYEKDGCLYTTDFHACIGKIKAQADKIEHLVCLYDLVHVNFDYRRITRLVFVGASSEWHYESETGFDRIYPREITQIYAPIYDLNPRAYHIQKGWKLIAYKYYDQEHSGVEPKWVIYRDTLDHCARTANKY